jgi:hypothetical protein
LAPMNKEKLIKFIFTWVFIVAYTFSPLALRPAVAASLSSVSDTLNRLQISIADVTHTMRFTPPTAINQDDGVQITIPAAFGDASLGVADYSITQGAGGTPCAAWTENAYVPANDVMQFECDTVGAAGTGQITVAITVDLDNPATVGEYEFLVETYDLGADGNFAGGDDVLEDNGYFSVPIVDDDTVNVTAYIDTYITFDIDTVTTDSDCDAAGGVTPCDTHGGATDNTGYVVSLGELATATVNDSGDSVLHADSVTGAINSIWFDIETNAASGAAVTVVSLREALFMDGSNSIPDVATGSEQQITAGSNLYGINVPSTATNSATVGSIIVHDDCDADSGNDYYCDVSDGGTPIQIFTTNSLPIQAGRVQWEVAASPSITTSVGTYTDELTFVATATF